METNNYRKVYPFEKSVFTEKFIARTIPVGIKYYQNPLGRKLEERMFVGEIRGKRIKIVTMPDMWTDLRHPLPGIRKIPVWRNPSCLYGSIQEVDGQTIVDYTIDIVKFSKSMSKERIVFGYLGILLCIISMFADEFQPNAILGVFIFILLIISSKSALHPHQSEHDALIKFMEDLEE